MTVTPQPHVERVNDALREALELNLAAATGDRAPLELNTSIRCAPDDATRQQIVAWAAAHGHDLAAFAATRPTPVIWIDDPGSVFTDAWRQGRSLAGSDDDSDVPLQAWLLHREVAERFRDKLIGRVITYDNDGILEAQRLLRESLDACGMDDTGTVQLRGAMRPVQITLTITTGDAS